jgi:hypothetical protein
MIVPESQRPTNERAFRPLRDKTVVISKRLKS